MLGPGAHSLRLDRELSPGVYVMNVETNEGTLTGKVVVPGRNRTAGR